MQTGTDAGFGGCGTSEKCSVVFTLVLGLLDDVWALVSIEPRLHAEVRLSALLVQLVPRFVSGETIAQDSLKTHMVNGSAPSRTHMQF